MSYTLFQHHRDGQRTPEYASLKRRAFSITKVYNFFHLPFWTQFTIITKQKILFVDQIKINLHKYGFQRIKAGIL